MKAGLLIQLIAISYRALMRGLNCPLVIISNSNKSKDILCYCLTFTETSKEICMYLKKQTNTKHETGIYIFTKITTYKTGESKSEKNTKMYSQYDIFTTIIKADYSVCNIHNETRALISMSRGVMFLSIFCLNTKHLNILVRVSF